MYSVLGTARACISATTDRCRRSPDLIGHLPEPHGDIGALDEVRLLEQLQELGDRREHLINALDLGPFRCELDDLVLAQPSLLAHGGGRQHHGLHGVRVPVAQLEEPLRLLRGDVVKQQVGDVNGALARLRVLGIVHVTFSSP
jgi:hypothetical protein